MNTLMKRVLVLVPVALLPIGVVTLLGTGCELAVNLDPMVIDAGTSDVLNCNICADVSADANYDAPDVSIYGILPVDAGQDATLSDAAHDATTRDATAGD